MVEHLDSDLDRLYNIIDELTPDDVGEQRIGEYVLKFEGFSDWCQDDAAERCELPDGDPRKLDAYEDVYDEVQGGWDKEMGSEPIDAGFSGDEDYPVQWAIYKTNINENLRDRFGKSKRKKKKAKKKQVQKETKGIPYPGTYEQEYDPFKTKGQRRTTGMTY
jgi:hypothetical protein